MNPHEERLTDAIVHVIDLASRVLTAAPGTHYQWMKTAPLAEAVEQLRDRLGGDEYAGHDVDPAAVEDAVARASQHYALGAALYRRRTTHATVDLPFLAPESAQAVDLDPALARIVEDEYDTVLIDTPPSDVHDPIALIESIEAAAREEQQP